MRSKEHLSWMMEAFLKDSEHAYDFHLLQEDTDRDSGIWHIPIPPLTKTSIPTYISLLSCHIYGTGPWKEFYPCPQLCLVQTYLFQCILRWPLTERVYFIMARGCILLILLACRLRIEALTVHKSNTSACTHLLFWHTCHSLSRSFNCKLFYFCTVPFFDYWGTKASENKMYIAGTLALRAELVPYSAFVIYDKCSFASH